MNEAELLGFVMAHEDSPDARERVADELRARSTLSLSTVAEGGSFLDPVLKTPPARCRSEGQGFWTRKFRVPVTLSSRTSMRQLPGDPVLVANVPVIERSRLYISAPDGGRIVSMAVPLEICPD